MVFDNKSCNGGRKITSFTVNGETQYQGAFNSGFDSCDLVMNVVQVGTFVACTAALLPTGDQFPNGFVSVETGSAA